MGGPDCLWTVLAVSPGGVGGGAAAAVRFSSKKAAGSAKNGRSSAGRRLGIKKNQGEHVKVGQIIIRQRGTPCNAGQGVGIGKDHTLFAVREGFVKFSYEHVQLNPYTKQGKMYQKKFVNVVDPQEVYRRDKTWSKKALCFQERHRSPDEHGPVLPINMRARNIPKHLAHLVTKKSELQSEAK